MPIYKRSIYTVNFKIIIYIKFVLLYCRANKPGQCLCQYMVAVKLNNPLREGAARVK